MSDIKLTSKEYCESVFVDGPKFDKLSAFVSGPDAQVQSKLTAGTGINLNGSTISVNTASSVGTSTLPVTASAVNTKLSSYVNSVSSPDGSITVSKSGSSVTLKANASGGSKWITDGSDGGRTWLTLGYDKDKITVNSVFVTGPLYDKDGNEIRGGGGAAPGCFKTDSDGSAFITGPAIRLFNTDKQCYLIYDNAVGGLSGLALQYEGPGGQKAKIGMASDYTSIDATLELESYYSNGDMSGRCQLNGIKLEKLSSLIANADALLALLNN